MFSFKSHKLSTLLIGACVGALLALLLELLDRSPLVIFLLLAAMVVTWLLVEYKKGVVFDPVGRFSNLLNVLANILLVALMTAITFWIEVAFGINPIGHFYLPLLPLVIMSTALLNLWSGFFAIILSCAVSAFFFIPPTYSLWIYELEDTIGLVIFAVIGSLVALGIQKFGLYREFRQ